MRRLKTFTVVAGMLVAGVAPAAAYYHYVHYSGSTSPYTPIFEKFDLATLPDQAVTFFVSDAGPSKYAANDSFPSVLSQIREATRVWNSVSTSALRVKFGGLETTGTPQNAPGGEVVFEELPPGLLAFAGPAATSDVNARPDGSSFVPIVRSLVHLNIDMTKKPGPSYMESFFVTVVHEMGHALGLQHTFTSATMSTAVTRATSRARPLDADDIAGLSMLYPSGAFPSAFGSITGRVTSGGQGVHLASVVALLPNGSAISSLTNPDGTYEIDGVPPGDYWVYAHPLPPTADIWLPRDTNANAVAAGGAFVSTFYPGTADPSQFALVTVAHGKTADSINFSVQPRSGVEIYDISTYSFFGQNPVQPAYLNGSANLTTQTIVANGNGITSGANAASGLSVQVLGGSGPAAVTAYGSPNTSLALYLPYPSAPASGPEHLLFKLPDDIYVLPGGIQIVQTSPPAITALNSNADGSVTITGTGLNSGSRVFFDGVAGRVTVPYAATPPASGTDQSSAVPSGSVSVIPPPGASGQVSTATVFNGDGQNSMFVQSQSPYTYTYPQTGAPAASVSIASLPRGATSMVDVKTSNLQFVDGLITLGFGSGDITVSRLWVLGPNHVIANVEVSPWAAQTSAALSVISGFETYEQPSAFQIQPADPKLPIIDLPVSNAFTLQNSLYPGAIASMYGVNLAAATGTKSITVGGQQALILYASSGQINFVVPASVPVGPAVVRLHSGTAAANPVVVQIDPRPPVITGLSSATAAPGDTITLTLTGIDPSVLAAPSRLTVTEGGIPIPTITVQQASDGSGAVEIQFVLDKSISGSQIPITVSLDGDLGWPIYLNVTAPAASSGA